MKNLTRTQVEKEVEEGVIWMSRWTMQKNTHTKIETQIKMDELVNNC